MERREVLIAGGGPIGLALALDLAWRGTPPVLVDQGDGTVDHPRAGGISIRTMEHCRRWGIAHAVRHCGFNLHLPLNQRFCVSVMGFELAVARYPSIADMPASETSPELLQRCRQMWFDPILAKAARSHGADLRYHQTLESFEQADDGVICRIADAQTGARSEIFAHYMVACDGAASGIRETLKIPMQGEVLGRSVSILFSANIRELLGGDPAERFILMRTDGPFGTITSMDGYDLWRLIVREPGEFRVETFDAASYIRGAIRSPNAEIEVLSVRPWKRQQVLARTYRSGNVLLAGDSAHVMVPTGGFGANTGIGDSVDLGWKLNAIQSGWAPQKLLDTYETERRPIALRNMAAALRNYKAWTPGSALSLIEEDSPQGAHARATIGEELVEGTRAEWESTGVALGYSYLDSPICVPDGTPVPPDDPADYIPTARPGSRAPHAWVADGWSTLDLFGRGFTLLRFAGRSAEELEPLLHAAEARKLPIHIEDIRNSKIATLYAARLVLVRPDGHVAWRGEAAPPADELLAKVTGG
jgi:2-polyprenyl-6-methoxyphenol hydroxylase-like FAD-dependent oxidoreductase